MYLRAAVRALPLGLVTLAGALAVASRGAAVATIPIVTSSVGRDPASGTDASVAPASAASLANDAGADDSAGARSRELLLELCETTRLAGTRASQVAAQKVAQRLTDAGWSVELEPRVVMLSYPRRTELAVFERGADVALHERVETFDPDRVPAGDVPLYNAWSASSSVRGPVVDAGRGLRADFERLRAAGVELRGAIALCRYGGCYRGIKVDLADRYGCAGVLLWSDPKQDGAERGATWPEGPWKHEHEAQRGSISPMGRTPGDPSTPGWPSPKPGEPGRRSSADELAASLPRIPCTPIGVAEARMLLEGLERRAFAGKDGAAVEEAVGPGPREVRLTIDAPRELRTIWNVVGTLAGASEEFVLAGAHRDAWVRGANDNASGCVVLLRAAQILGERARGGWKPAHTLKLAFWDGEEFGLIGSTEWAEAHVDLVRDRCVAYVNSDVAATGTRFTGASGTPGMLGALESALRAVPAAPGAPNGASTLWDEWTATRKDGAKPDLGLPGSGSDFAVFVHHLGVPFVEVGLGGNGGGQYHTSFDDVAIVERFLDPGYVGHELCARLHVELLGELARRGRGSFDALEAVQALRRSLFPATSSKDSAHPAGMALAESRIATALAMLDTTWSAEGADRVPVPDFYRALLQPSGLPGRPWYRNALWAPGLEDGYGAEVLPTLRALVGAGAGAEEIVAEGERIAAALCGLRRVEER